MKTSSIVLLAFSAIASVQFAHGVTMSELKNMTPEEKAANKAKSQEFLMKRTGGFVRKAGSGKGLIMVVNAQERVPLVELQKPLSYIEKRIHLPVGIRNAKMEGRPSAEKVKKAGGTFGIFVVDDKDCDAPLIVAPENKWAQVNVAQLAKDDPDMENLSSRAQVEVARAFTYLCGGADSQYPGSIMGPITGVGDIDKVMGYAVPGDAFQKIHTYLRAYGVEPYVEGTYRSACQQGWAPAPTNDYQKAIWEEVHALPSNPMKIKFDPNAKKGVVEKRQ